MLDACLSQDPTSKVACETCTKTGMVMIFGEITTKATLNYEEIVRSAVARARSNSHDIAQWPTCLTVGITRALALNAAR